jgi:hypothetical protein
MIQIEILIMLRFGSTIKGNQLNILLVYWLTKYKQRFQRSGAERSASKPRKHTENHGKKW